MTDVIPAKKSFLISFLIDPKYRIGRHLLLVLFFATLAFNMMYLTCVDMLDQVDHVIFYITLSLLATYLVGLYLNNYVLLPRLLLKNRYISYMICVSLVITVQILVTFLCDYQIVSYYREEPSQYSFFYKDRILAVEIAGNFFLYALVIAGASISVLVKHWLKASARQDALEKTNLRTELERLKDRMNPEFLFAMLDEAGEQTIGNPEQASAILMKLSKLLRYQLYDGGRELVLLISEISFIENFLKLAQMRYQSLVFKLSTEGDVSRVVVPPLLFVPVVIYAARQLSAKDMRLDIHLCFRREEEGISFLCLCFTPDRQKEQDRISTELDDLRSRLDLLYQNTYALETTEEGSLLKTNLYIKL